MLELRHGRRTLFNIPDKLTMPVCFLPLCSLTGSLGRGSSRPTPGLLVSRYPCSSGASDKETVGSPKFPSSPCDDMLRSPQTPVVSCPPRRYAGRTATCHSFHSVCS